jgi:hypothetical protein
VLEPILRALAKKDGAAALDGLVLYWRRRRVPELRAAVITLAARIGAADPAEGLLGKTAAAAQKKIAAQSVADPRILAAILGWLEDPPYPTSKPFWTATFALLERCSDSGTVSELPRDFPSLKGKSKEWLGEQLAAVRTNLTRRIFDGISDENAAAIAKAVAAF